MPLSLTQELECGRSFYTEILPDLDTGYIDRPMNEFRRHLSFRYGTHFSLGPPIAQLEAQTGRRYRADR
jgi:hypothetical protein